LKQTAGGQANAWKYGTGPLPVDSCNPWRFEPSLRSDRLRGLLGIEVSDARIESILTGFGLQKTEKGWKVPSWRSDLTREVDLIEEIARVIGMDAIPARTQARFAGASESDRAYDRAMTLRRAFVAQGLHEARSLTLVPRNRTAQLSRRQSPTRFSA